MELELRYWRAIVRKLAARVPVLVAQAAREVARELGLPERPR